MPRTNAGHSEESLLVRHKGCWFAAATLPLLICLLFPLENWLGARQLAKTKNELESAGITLAPERLLPALPPEEENFGAAPMLRALAENDKSHPGVRAVEETSTWLRPEIDGKTYFIRLPHAKNPVLPDWEEIHRNLVGDPPPENTTPSENLAKLLEEKAGAVFAELENYLPRPQAMVPPGALARWQDQSEPRKSDPMKIVPFGDVLQLRFFLALANREPDRAAQSWIIRWRFAEFMDHETGVPMAVIGMALRYIGLDSLKIALRERYFPPQTLREIQRHLSVFDGQASLEFSLRLNCIEIPEDIERWRRSPSSIRQFFDTSSLPAWDWLPGGGWDNYFAELAEFTPKGWFDFNEAAYLQAHASLLQLVQDSSRPDRFSTPSLKAAVPEKSGFPYHERYAAELFSMTLRYFQRHAELISSTRLAEAACALECYYHVHQEYPPDLQALMPDFLGKLPLDFDGSPIRYAKTPENSRYQLWSVGVDGADDGGSKGSISFGVPKAATASEKSADLVWEYGQQ